MRTRRKLKPGERGTHKLLVEHGKRLVCVRYRYDKERQKRYTTVELIVAEAEWKPKRRGPHADDLVGLKIGLGEYELRQKVKQGGGQVE